MLVAAPRPDGAQDVLAGRAQVDRGEAIVGKPGPVVVVVRGRHRDDGVEGQLAGPVVDARVVVVLRVVARRRQQEDVLLVRVGHGVPQGLAVVVHETPAAAHHSRAVVRRVDDALGRVRAEALKVLPADDAQRHDAHPPVDAGDPDAVVAFRPDDPGAVRAVAVVVHGIVVIILEVPATHVVDVPVAVVVHAVAWDLARVGPHVVHQIRVVVVNAGVQHCHHHVPRADGNVPRLLGVDIGVRCAAGLARVVQSPALRIAEIVGGVPKPDLPVGLGVDHPLVPPKALNSLLHGLARDEPHPVHTQPRTAPQPLDPQALAQFAVDQVGPDRVLELDQHFAGRVWDPVFLARLGGRQGGFRVDDFTLTPVTAEDGDRGENPEQTDLPQLRAH